MENGFANPFSSHRKRRAVGYFRTLTVETGIGKQLATKLFPFSYIPRGVFSTRRQAKSFWTDSWAKAFS
jgi:hypothetical protein